jgi:hypothetical protein
MAALRDSLPLASSPPPPRVTLLTSEFLDELNPSLFPVMYVLSDIWLLPLGIVYGMHSCESEAEDGTRR